MVTLDLLVLRCSDLAATLRFYQALGLSFVREQHGAGPPHHAAQLGPLVLELYPLRPGAAAEAPAVRLGFRVAALARAVEAVEALGARVAVAPEPHAGGLRAVVEDPDGRQVELTQGDGG